MWGDVGSKFEFREEIRVPGRVWDLKNIVSGGKGESPLAKERPAAIQGEAHRGHRR